MRKPAIHRPSAKRTTTRDRKAKIPNIVDGRSANVNMMIPSNVMSMNNIVMGARTCRNRHQAA
jgi:hypothetical protein